MSEAPELIYESKYSNSPLVVLGAMAILAAGFAAGWAAVLWLPRDALMAPILEIAAATLSSIFVLRLAASGRHRWTVEGDVLHITETGRFAWLSPPREVAIPLASIRALRRVESGFDVMLELDAGPNIRHRMMQGYARDNVGVLLPDKNGLIWFANAMRKRIVAAGAQAPSFQDGLGFWNRRPGLAVLAVLLTATIGLSGLTLYGLVTGAHVPEGAAMQGLAFVLMSPLIFAYALYRSWARRSFVLGLSTLRDKLTSKG